jgi:uncharacterized protein (TIGR03437 family)
MKIQVAANAAALKLALVSGGGQVASPGVPLKNPIVVRVVDGNDVAYAGVRVSANVTSGTLAAAQALTDDKGTAGFAWTPGAGRDVLMASIDGSTATLAVTAFGAPAVTGAGVVNAASFEPGLAPGGLASVFGVDLSAGVSADAPALPWPTELGGVQVRVNGAAVPVLAVRNNQVNFLLPETTPAGPATLSVTSPLGTSAAVAVTVSAVAPGIFFDPPDGFGAVLVANSGGHRTSAQPALAGTDYLEIYATGLGAVHASATQQGLFETDLPVKVFIGTAEAADVPFAGLAPGFTGLYQVNAKVPAGTPSGTQQVSIEIGGRRSNSVKIQVR